MSQPVVALIPEEERIIPGDTAFRCHLKKRKPLKPASFHKASKVLFWGTRAGLDYCLCVTYLACDGDAY